MYVVFVVGVPVGSIVQFLVYDCMIFSICMLFLNKKKDLILFEILLSLIRAV